MSDDTGHEEHSHYEISLTAGQAFVAFVLLLLSLAASFGFGLMIGHAGQEDRVVVRKEQPVVTEASVIPKKNSGKIVELGVADSDFKTTTSQTDTATTAAPVVSEGAATATDTTATAATSTAPAAEPPKAVTETPAAGAAKTPAAQPKNDHPAAAKSGTVYAQLLSTADQKTAEALATKLINRGFTSAYVDRASNEKGPVFRVRVAFASEAEARASESKLKEFAKDVWIVK
jgi:cell division septation protein DedD